MAYFELHIIHTSTYTRMQVIEREKQFNQKTFIHPSFFYITF